LLVGVLALVLVAGCGGTTSPPAKVARTTTTTARAAPPPPASKGPRNGLIGIADLSHSWTIQERAPSGLRCGGWDPLRGATKRLESARFNRQTIDMQETLGVFADDAAAQRAYRRLAARATQRCMSRAMQPRMLTLAGDRTVVSPLTVVRTEAIGRRSSAIRYGADVRGELGEARAYIVTINSRVGRAVASLTVLARLAKLTEEVFEQLAERVERRLTAAFGE
jgi:hypothetical protein